jgi:hypothetical protein
MRAFTVAVLIVWAVSVHRTDADSWPTAQIKEVFSAWVSGRRLRRIPPNGRVVFAHELKHLFSPEEVETFRRSVSSIWWRTETVYVRDGQQSVYISLDGKGSELIVEPETGHWQCCEWRKEAA